MAIVIVDLPIENGDFPFSIVMLVYQRVVVIIAMVIVVILVIVMVISIVNHDNMLKIVIVTIMLQYDFADSHATYDPYTVLL
jgi:hypothetical protein